MMKLPSIYFEKRMNRIERVNHWEMMIQIRPNQRSNVEEMKQS